MCAGQHGMAERDRQRQSMIRLHASKTLINFTPPPVIKFILSKLNMPLTACLTPVLLKLVAAKKSNVRGIHSLCSLFQQTYEEQLPNNSRECVSERFFCPAVPSAWLNCMQARVCGSNFKPL